MKKVSIGILGATGIVGQTLIQLLHHHPWFEIAELSASSRSTGKKYADSVEWRLQGEIPEKVAGLTLLDSASDFKSDYLLSALSTAAAAEIEPLHIKKGKIVISNAAAHRMLPDVPLIIPEVNPDHLSVVLNTSNKTGKLIANPNCSTIGIALALKPLHDAFGVQSVFASTYQAVSGAGYPGCASYDLIDNVIPYIDGEEEKIQTEIKKIFSCHSNSQYIPAEITLSAHCVRVPVTDGHLTTLSLSLKKNPSIHEIRDIFQNFTPYVASLQLPSSPPNAIIIHDEPFFPQPKLHRLAHGGMSVHIGNIRTCPLGTVKFTILSHNTIRGAAGGSLLIAELFHKEKSNYS